MSIFLCTANGDLDLSGNVITLVDGPQEVLQLVRNNLRFFFNEDPLNPGMGVPYFQQILDKSTPPTTSEAILKSVVANTDGVSKVLGFQLTLSNNARQATVTFTAVVNGSPITATESFP